MIRNQQDCPVIDENERILRLEYQFRRYGIIVLSLVILAALNSLWSSGYSSEAHRESAAGELSVDYQRYTRLMSETEVNIQIKPDGGNEKIINFIAPFLSCYQIDGIRPQPDKMYNAEGKLYLVYQQAANRSPMSVWLSITPKTAGDIFLQAAVNDRAPVAWNQFVYPQERLWKWSSELQQSILSC